MYHTILLNKFSQYWIFPFPKSSINIVFSCQRQQGLRTTALLLWAFYMVCVWLRIFLTDSPAPCWEADSAEFFLDTPTLFRISVPIRCRFSQAGSSSRVYTQAGRDTTTLLLSPFCCRCSPEHFPWFCSGCESLSQAGLMFVPGLVKDHIDPPSFLPYLTLWPAPSGLPESLSPFPGLKSWQNPKGFRSKSLMYYYGKFQWHAKIEKTV